MKSPLLGRAERSNYRTAYEHRRDYNEQDRNKDLYGFAPRDEIDIINGFLSTATFCSNFFELTPASITHAVRSSTDRRMIDGITQRALAARPWPRASRPAGLALGRFLLTAEPAREASL
jgi:hypothetical protein